MNIGTLEANLVIMWSMSIVLYGIVLQVNLLFLLANQQSEAILVFLDGDYSKPLDFITTTGELVAGSTDATTTNDHQVNNRSKTARTNDRRRLVEWDDDSSMVEDPHETGDSTFLVTFQDLLGPSLATATATTTTTEAPLEMMIPDYHHNYLPLEQRTELAASILDSRARNLAGKLIYHGRLKPNQSLKLDDDNRVQIDTHLPVEINRHNYHNHHDHRFRQPSYRRQPRFYRMPNRLHNMVMVHPRNDYIFDTDWGASASLFGLPSRSNSRISAASSSLDDGRDKQQVVVSENLGDLFDLRPDFLASSDWRPVPATIRSGRAFSRVRNLVNEALVRRNSVKQLNRLLEFRPSPLSSGESSWKPITGDRAAIMNQRLRSFRRESSSANNRMEIGRAVNEMSASNLLPLSPPSPVSRATIISDNHHQKLPEQEQQQDAHLVQLQAKQPISRSSIEQPFDDEGTVVLSSGDGGEASTRYPGKLDANQMKENGSRRIHHQPFQQASLTPPPPDGGDRWTPVVIATTSTSTTTIAPPQSRLVNVTFVEPTKAQRSSESDVNSILSSKLITTKAQSSAVGTLPSASSRNPSPNRLIFPYKLDRADGHYMLPKRLDQEYNNDMGHQKHQLGGPEEGGQQKQKQEEEKEGVTLGSRRLLSRPHRPSYPVTIEADSQLSLAEGRKSRAMMLSEALTSAQTIPFPTHTPARQIDHTMASIDFANTVEPPPPASGQTMANNEPEIVQNCTTNGSSLCGPKINPSPLQMAKANQISNSEDSSDKKRYPDSIPFSYQNKPLVARKTETTFSPPRPHKTTTYVTESQEVPLFTTILHSTQLMPATKSTILYTSSTGDYSKQNSYNEQQQQQQQQVASETSIYKY